jgi:hypothetical protein
MTAEGSVGAPTCSLWRYLNCLVTNTVSSAYTHEAFKGILVAIHFRAVPVLLVHAPATTITTQTGC